MTDNENHIDFKLYRYDPSLIAAAIFISLFAGTSIWHTWKLIRTRTWFFIAFAIGGHMEWVGYIGRAMSSQESPNWTLGPYIMQTLLLLVAPALYAASIYMELGRIIALTAGERHSVIRRQWLTKIFVIGDVISFVAQGAGGGIMAGGSIESTQTGEHIIIAGLIVQLIFFSLFVVTAGIFNVRMRRNPTPEVHNNPSNPWQKHLMALYIGSALIFIRSLFRLIEYIQGNDGYLISHEIFLYLFDACLMLATMWVFAFIHPAEISVLMGGRYQKPTEELALFP